jgi:hypothetical protein
MGCKPFAVDNYHTDILLLSSPLNTSRCNFEGYDFCITYGSAEQIKQKMVITETCRKKNNNYALANGLMAFCKHLPQIGASKL